MERKFKELNNILLFILRLFNLEERLENENASSSSSFKFLLGLHRDFVQRCFRVFSHQQECLKINYLNLK